MTATRKLAAILAADVVGYSRLIGLDEEGTIARLQALRHEVIDPDDLQPSRPHHQDHGRRSPGRHVRIVNNARQ
jgi:hypothetical protein